MADDGPSQLEQHLDDAGEERSDDDLGLSSNEDSYDGDWSAIVDAATCGVSCATDHAAGTGSNSIMESLQFDAGYDGAGAYSGSNSYYDDDSADTGDTGSASNSNSNSADYDPFSAMESWDGSDYSASNSNSADYDPYSGMEPWDGSDYSASNSNSADYASLAPRPTAAWGGSDYSTSTSTSNSAEHTSFRQMQPLGGYATSDTTEPSTDTTHDTTVSDAFRVWSNVMHDPAVASSIAHGDVGRRAGAACRSEIKATRPANGAGPVPAQAGAAHRRTQRSTASRRAPTKLDWSFAYDLLTGRVINTYPVRPYCAEARAVRQIFFERPLQRLPRGGDRWRNSGGGKGSSVRWITENEGIRKRYGQLQRRDPTLKRLSFTQCSLIRKDPQHPEKIEDDYSAYVFTIEPCEVGDAETLEPPAVRAAPHFTAFADASEVTANPNSAAGIAVLDFGLVKGRVSNRAKQVARKGPKQRKRGRALLPEVSDTATPVDGSLLSEFTFDGGDLQPKRTKRYGAAGWPFGQATLVKATLLSLAVMALGGYMIATGWQLMATPSASGLCDAHTFRLAISGHTDCTPCRDCAAQGFETLFKCTASANACVSLSVCSHQPAFCTCTGKLF